MGLVGVGTPGPTIMRMDFIGRELSSVHPPDYRARSCYRHELCGVTSALLFLLDLMVIGGGCSYMVIHWATHEHTFFPSATVAMAVRSESAVINA